MKTEEDLRRPGWMTDDQWRCYELMARVFGGFHHVTYEPKKWGRGIKVSIDSGKLATWDFNYLTRLVVLAHDECIRVGIISGGPRLVSVELHARKGREGSMFERHPTLEDAASIVRGSRRGWDERKTA